MSSHVDLLSSRFGPPAADDHLPLFPTADGGLVSPETMLELIELLATMLGEDLYSKEGRRKYGKHSWRSTGAVFLAGIGVDLLKIQLMARWSSEVITHYSRLAPLKAITADFKRAVMERSGKSKSSSKADVRSIKSAVDVAMAKVTEEVKELDMLVRRIQHETRPARYLRNRTTNKVHRILCGYEEAGPSAITHCGWKYAGQTVAVEQDAPTIYKQVCGTCLPALKASLAL